MSSDRPIAVVYPSWGEGTPIAREGRERDGSDQAAVEVQQLAVQRIESERFEVARVVALQRIEGQRLEVRRLQVARLVALEWVQGHRVEVTRVVSVERVEG